MLLKFALLLSLLSHVLFADEIRPAYLEITETSDYSYSILLKVPAKGDKRLSMAVKEIKNCVEIGSHITAFVNASYIDRYTIKCTENIKGKVIDIEGLKHTKIDLLLRLEFLDKTSHSVLLNPLNTSYLIQKEASSFQIVQTYTWLGITHILLGFDHLLFVFALLLIVKSMRRLLWTITAFTLAHSITMAGATLGFVHIPQAPVEAMIALSILFLAMEIVHEKQGKIGLTSRYPWLIAFIFGLLHGFGFAGALAEIGLPQQAISLALICFNIGVELGQLMFVATVVLLGLGIQRFGNILIMQKAEILMVYAIGTLSAFWVFERLSGF